MLGIYTPENSVETVLIDFKTKISERRESISPMLCISFCAVFLFASTSSVWSCSKAIEYEIPNCKHASASSLVTDMTYIKAKYGRESR